MSIKLGVPSKGRLMEKTFDWFAERGVTLSRTGSDREYAGKVEGIDGVELVLLSAGEIPRELAAGRIHLGVTGTDLVREKLGQWEQQVAELATLGFGHADLIIAVPGCWVDVDTLEDLDADALVTILTKPKNALVKQYQRLFELEETELDFTDEALKAIAGKAIERKTGARGLRSIMEDILLDTMFDLPGMESVEKVVVNEEAVTSDKQPLMIHAEGEKEPASAG